MVIEEIKKIKSSNKELKEFALVIGGGLLLLAGLLFWRNKTTYPYFTLGGILVLTIRFIKPLLLKPLQKAWMTLAILMGWVMTRLILIILFYAVLTPISFIARLFGQQFLDTKFKDGKNSYWIPKKKVSFDKKRYENQF